MAWARRVSLENLLWPALLFLAISAYAAGSSTTHPIAAFNAVYFGLALTLFFLERRMPHERSWLGPNGELVPDLAHTALNKGIGQLLAALAGMAGASAGPAQAGPWWPAEWPLAAQVVLALAIAEFGLYWAHRLAHEWAGLWRFHAVHHSATTLWFVNTGRFHFVDSMWKSGCALALGFIAGAPREIVLYVLAITTFIGLLTHCNVRMANPWLSWLFNTPDLHRWHHSSRPEEGNTNYGENLTLWDVVFGTRYLPTARPPAEIGCPDPVPTTFLGQLAFPFRRRRGDASA